MQAKVLEDLNDDHERVRAVQRNNALEAALRHDWLHRPTECALAQNGSTRLLYSLIEERKSAAVIRPRLELANSQRLRVV